MKNVAASSDAFPTQRGFETGDDLNEENFDQLAQTAADRAEWLKLKVDTMLGIGVKKIRMVASPTELKALTGMASGDLALIPLTSSAAGLYVFQEGILPDNDIAKWVYKANDESGLWGRDCVPLLTEGVSRIQFYSSIAALQAVTGQSAGDVALALDSLGRLGLYHYNLDYSGPNIIPYVIKPAAFADVTSGRWVHLFHNYGAYDTDASGNNKWFCPGPGRVVETLESVVTSPSSTTYSDSPSWQDTGLSITKNLVSEDVITLQAIADWSVDPNEALSFRIRVDAPGGGGAIDGSQRTLEAIGANKRMLAMTQARWTAGESGSHTFKLQILVSAGGPYEAKLYAQRSMTGLWIRP